MNVQYIVSSRVAAITARRVETLCGHGTLPHRPQVTGLGTRESQWRQRPRIDTKTTSSGLADCTVGPVLTCVL